MTTPFTAEEIDRTIALSLELAALYRKHGFDSSVVGPLGELYAMRHLGMVKSERMSPGIDGYIGRRSVSVKTKERIRHPLCKNTTGVKAGKERLADDLLVVYIGEDGKLHHIGPVPMERLTFGPTNKANSLRTIAWTKLQ